MKDTDPAAKAPETKQTDASLDSLDSSLDQDELEEKKRLSAAMSSYYLLYR